MTFERGLLAPYRHWRPAHPSTCSDHVFLTGVGGILYPPDSLPLDLLSDVDAAQRICPFADDVWFWALSSLAGTERRCLASKSEKSIRRSAGSQALSDYNYFGGGNDVQLAKVLDHFGLEVRPHD